MDATITLAAIPAEPTQQNLQFTPDGQVLLATRSALYILVREPNDLLHNTRTNTPSQTPDLGVNFDASSTAKVPTEDFGWFRSVIDIGDIPPQSWSVDTQGEYQVIVHMGGLKPF